MARQRKDIVARLIQNKIYRDQDFLALDSTFAQLVFIAALGQVDPYGNLTASPRHLKNWILPGHQLSEDDIMDAFDMFAERGLTCYYVANDMPCIHFYGTENKALSKPEFPLPNGLTARLPEGSKSRTALWRIYDTAGNECDPDGQPLDVCVPRTAPKIDCEIYEMRELVRTCTNVYELVRTCTPKKKGKETKPIESPTDFSIGKGKESAREAAGACLDGTPAPAAPTAEGADIDPELAARFNLD